MKRLLLFLAVTFLVFGCAEDVKRLSEAYKDVSTTPEGVVQNAGSNLLEVKVLRVIDGDTIDVMFPNGTTDRVRLLGIDTPETTESRNRPYEYDSITNLTCLTEWGLEAKEFAKSMLDGRKVYLEFDSLAGTRGYYGRLLAYVYLENGTDFNAMLVEKGYARVYTEGTFEKEGYYVTLQYNAQEQNLGLWSCS